MNRSNWVTTFMTHEMDPDTVETLATGRDDELFRILNGIEQSVGDQSNRQHFVVYGERGAGKSFLIRLLEIRLKRWVKQSHSVVKFVLLTQEQVGIRTAAQLLRAIRMRLMDQQHTYIADKRSRKVAFVEESAELRQAIDQQFSAGKGLVVAGIENYDVLSRRIFGSQFGGKKKEDIEKRQDEEQFRKLLNDPSSRLQLICSATKTVDMDYDRPLFKAFESIDLSPWTPDACIEYYEKRRRLAGSQPLSPEQSARARAISTFISGNPRLAKLLGDVLDNDDSASINQVFDHLSDHLAEYYGSRLKDLADSAEDLLNALIMGGEPCTQSELAERIGQVQSEIAVAFRSLAESRIVVGEKKIGGRGQLYRVRDRLLVYFYRKRFGVRSEESTLIRASEWLAAFFSPEEKTDVSAGINDLLRENGRAEAYTHFVSLTEFLSKHDPRPFSRSNAHRLVLSVGSIIDDPGFLRDIADWLPDRFGVEEVSSIVDGCRTFADFHQAEDKEQFLQRLDPDISSAIRRIWMSEKTTAD